MLELKHFINDIPVMPDNGDDIGIKLDWTGDAKEAELNVDSIVLSTNAKRLVLEHKNTYGIYEGLPYRVEIGSTSIEYYIDLSDDPLLSGQGDSEIEVTIKRRKAVNWFRSQANGMSFESLNKFSPISTIDIPYLIVKDNQLELLITLGISTYTLTKALIEGIRDLAEAIAEVTQAATPNVGVPPSIDLGDVLAAVIKTAARIIYIAAIVIALIQLTKQIIELIYPPVRTLKASTIKELMQKGCTKLGYSFSSTIIDSLPQLTILPRAMRKKSKSIFTNLFTLDNGAYTNGYPGNQDTTPTLGRLIDELEGMFNAKIRIVGNIVYLERRDFWELNAGLNIRTTLTLQSELENRYRLNTGDMWKRYYMHFLTDPNDTHTRDKIDGTDCEYSTESISALSPDLSSITGLIDIPINFAFGIRKDSLTVVENATLPFAKAADSVVQFFGGSSSLESKVLGRIGVLQISEQHYSVSKLLYQVGGKQPKNYLDKISANSLYQKYHTINQVKENSKNIFDAPIPFSTDNVEMLLNNNYVNDQDGEKLEILTFEWINNTKTADIQYARKSDEGFNTQTILIDG